MGGSGEEDKEVDELGEEEEEEPPEVGDVLSADKTPKAAAQDTSPESDLRRLRVLLFTQLVYLFVFLAGAPNKGQVLAASPSPAYYGKTNCRKRKVFLTPRP